MPHTHTHTSALESVHARRFKENTSCLISKAQPSIFLWQNPYPSSVFSVRLFRLDSASSCFPRTNCSTLTALLTAERVIGCRLLPHHAAAQWCTTPGRRKRAGKIASKRAHLSNYPLGKPKTFIRMLHEDPDLRRH